MRNASPLRYPGGKWRLTRFFDRLIPLNFDRPPIYVEPYAGGASLALSLLFSGKVAEVWLNDLDPAINAFWRSVLQNTERLARLIGSVPVTPAEWTRQRAIYVSGLAAGEFALGFATFFLNRTNHSGILNGGMIGGKNQSGGWKLDARFNRAELVKRIRRIATHKDRIHLSCQDAIDLLRQKAAQTKRLLYLDPPYYHAGQRLYLNAYRPEDHAAVHSRILELGCPWVVSYDDTTEIRKLYHPHRSRSVRLLHTARTARQGEEIMFFSSGLRIPHVSV